MSERVEEIKRQVAAGYLTAYAPSDMEAVLAALADAEQRVRLLEENQRRFLATPQCSSADGQALCGSAQQLADAERALAEREPPVAPEVIYVPGHWQCAECGFFNVRAALHADSGQIGVGSDADVCPNDGALMQRVTWREIARASGKDKDELLERIVNLRTQLTAATQREGALREALRKEHANTMFTSLSPHRSYDPLCEICALLTPPPGYTLRDAIAAQEGDDED